MGGTVARLESVAVTGGSGRLGRYVVDELGGRTSVTVIDKRPAGTEPSHVEADILDLGAMRRALAGHDTLVHLAAIDGHVNATPETFFETNVQGTWNVLHAACEVGVKKAVVCSSHAATGLNRSNPHMPPLYLPIDESHPLRPTEAYGLSKAVTEMIARSFARRGAMEVVTIRPVYIMFPELVRHVAQRINDPSGGAESGSGALSDAFLEPLALLRSYVRPEDLARAFRLALETDCGACDLFYLTARDTFEPSPTLAYVERVYGALPEVRKPQVYEVSPHASPFDCARAQAVLGWKARGTWEELSGTIRS